MEPMLAGLGPIFDSEKLGSVIDIYGKAESWYSTVGGRLGEWLDLGGSAGEQSGSSGAIASYGTRTSSRLRRIQLKVEELP